jgi:hypothetical protein
VQRYSSIDEYYGPDDSKNKFILASFNSMETHLCQNCGNEYSENYCNRCGQKTIHRISLSHIGHEAFHAITHADKGIIHLFVQLLIRPGVVARAFIIEGKRKKYYNPVQYLLIIASIATFIVVTTHMMDYMMDVNPMRPSSQLSERQARFIKNASDFTSKYYNFVLLFQLPFFALGSYLVYRKHKLLYAEHLTLHIFITAQVTVLTTILMAFFVASNPRLFGILGSIVGILYTMVAYMQFFQERSFKGGLRGVFAYMLGFVFYLIFLAVIAGITLMVILVLKKAG